MSKASNLQRLRAAGFNVPPFVVIPAEVCAAFLAAMPGPLTAQQILETPLPEALARHIVKTIPFQNSSLAVRSSVADEDSAEHSFAGQFDSFLNVRGEAALLAAVKACWASAYGDRALEYRRRHNLSAAGLTMEVIVQTMVPAEASGILFTADPTARDPRWMVISAVSGLGAALAQGDEPGETWRVHRATGDVQGSGRVLDSTQLRALVDMAEKIQAVFGGPQDIEFALANHQIFILQTRPITTPLPPYPVERMLWDNSNITESYSGVTTPLTFSLIRSAYASVYRQFLEVMGVRQYDEGVLRNMLGFYRGQVYYQLLNWYALMAYLPGFKYNRSFMEQMMGVKQAAGKELAANRRGRLEVARWVGRLIGLYVTGERRVKNFLAHFNAVLAEYQAKDFNAFTPRQLRAAYDDIQTRILGHWRAPILADFFGMVFFGLLRKLSERWLERGGALHNDLLAGDGTIESMQPVRRVQQLARQVRAAPALSALFALPDATDTLQQLRARSEFAAFFAEFEDYLLRYGDRCMNELKLEEPNLRDDPARLVRLIAAAVAHPVEFPDESVIRTRAEARLASLRFWQKPVFCWVLAQTRQHIRNRENMRFARSRLFGLSRGLFNALGAQWAQLGVLEQPRDIYYLTVNEIWDFVEGTATTLNLRGLVALRREEYTEHEQVALPDRFETLGLPYLDSPRDLLAQSSNGAGQLQGTGCCSGRVIGAAQVVQCVDGAPELRGRILVAERTDPGWIFLFPLAAGILVERGSPLSHSAIVAREMGKPIIVNIPNLTKRVKTGDEVEMDGGSGTVCFKG